MKKITFGLLFLYLLVLTTSIGNANKASANGSLELDKTWAVCTYRLTFHRDSTDRKLRTEDYRLLLGKKTSRFQSQSARSRDSLTDITVHLPPNQTSVDFYSKLIYSLPQASFRYIIYKTPATGQLIYYDWIGTNFYRYEEPQALFHWVIMPATATIGRYACQKATTSFAGRKFEAWFTREIPVSDGPYKFYGLPGLIVKVGDTRGQYVFELTHLAKITAETVIELPVKKAQLTTKPQFKPAQAAYFLSLADRMASMGNTISPEARERLKRRNPLELR